MSRPRGRPKSETASASGTREGSRKLLKVLVAEQEDAAHCDDDNGDDADAVQLLFQETEETGDYKIKVAVDVSRVNWCAQSATVPGAILIVARRAIRSTTQILPPPCGTLPSLVTTSKNALLISPPW